MEAFSLKRDCPNCQRDITTILPSESRNYVVAHESLEGRLFIFYLKMFYGTVESNTFSTDGIDNSLSSEGKISPHEFNQ